MILYINTTLENKLEVALYDQKGHKILDKTQAVKRDESEKLLQMIAEAIKNRNQDIKAIIVVKGPKGRFSAIRTAVVCANALGFAWNIPVFGIEHGQNVKTALQRISKLKNFTKPAMPVYPPKFL